MDGLAPSLRWEKSSQKALGPGFIWRGPQHGAPAGNLTVGYAGNLVRDSLGQESRPAALEDRGISAEGAAEAAALRRHVVELPSNKGHMASHADSAMWAPILAAFMKGL